MKRVLIFAALVLCASLSSCQCAEKPDVGPVEGDDEQAAVQTGPSGAFNSGVSVPRV
jgi:hypothetical protein